VNGFTWESQLDFGKYKDMTIDHVHETDHEYLGFLIRDGCTSPLIEWYKAETNRNSGRLVDELGKLANG